MFCCEKELKEAAVYRKVSSQLLLSASELTEWLTTGAASVVQAKGLAQHQLQAL